MPKPTHVPLLLGGLIHYLQSQAPPAVPTAARASKRPTHDTLRKQLATALTEYQYLDTKMCCLPEQLEGWPLSSEEPCGACAGYREQTGRIHTMHFDACFKLPLLKWRKYGWLYAAPENRRVFAGNEAIQEFESSSEGYLKTAASKGNYSTHKSISCMSSSTP